MSFKKARELIFMGAFDDLIGFVLEDDLDQLDNDIKTQPELIKTANDQRTPNRIIPNSLIDRDEPVGVNPDKKSN